MVVSRGKWVSSLEWVVTVRLTALVLWFPAHLPSVGDYAARRQSPDGGSSALDFIFCVSFKN